jgi:tRNA-2-methylthio-N6-dimethylallyladenosine synthase
VYGHLGHLKTLKEKGTLRVLGICGCMAQDQADRLFRRAPHVDLIVGTDAYPRIARLIDDVLKEDIKQVDTTFYAEEEPEPSTEHMSGPEWEPYPVGTAAFTPDDIRYPVFLPIMRGCDFGCTYCVVPSVRGKEICRSPESILREAREMVDAGVRAITLIGQVVNAYEHNDTSFAELLRLVSAIDGLDRLMFVTSHPRKFGDDIIDAASGSDRIVPYFHIPIQSGSNRILKRMARGYKVEDYCSLVSRIRDRIPEAAVTSDLILGFPGETDEDFEDTLRFVEETRLNGIFCFRYSPRRGTPAAGFSDQVPEPVKIERLERIIEVQKRISTEINRKLEGTVQEVFVEEVGDTARGRNRQNKVTVFPLSDSVQPGHTVPVKIERAGAFTLYGRMVSWGQTRRATPAPASS